MKGVTVERTLNSKLSLELRNGTKVSLKAYQKH